LLLCFTSRNLAGLAASIAQSLDRDQSASQVMEKEIESTFPRKLHYLWPNKNFSFGDEDPNHIEQRQILVRALPGASDPVGLGAARRRGGGN
ncbi:MAG: hypothetical protein AAGB93_14890, partial [Planctomycetota bacterium]